MLAAATRHARSLHALAERAGADAAHEVAVELGRLRAGLDAVATVDRERADRVDVELEGLAARIGRLETILGEHHLGARQADTEEAAR